MFAEYSNISEFCLLLNITFCYISVLSLYWLADLVSDEILVFTEIIG